MLPNVQSSDEFCEFRETNDNEGFHTAICSRMVVSSREHAHDGHDEIPGTWSCGETARLCFQQPSQNNFGSEEKKCCVVLTTFQFNFTHIRGREQS